MNIKSPPANWIAESASGVAGPSKKAFSGPAFVYLQPLSQIVKACDEWKC